MQSFKNRDQTMEDDLSWKDNENWETSTEIDYSKNNLEKSVQNVGFQEKISKIHEAVDQIVEKSIGDSQISSQKNLETTENSNQDNHSVRKSLLNGLLFREG